MKSIATFSLGALAYMTATQAGSKPSSTFVNENGLIWNDDKTLCLWLDNRYLKRRSIDDWNNMGESTKEKKIENGKPTPRCEDTIAYWSDNCRRGIDSGWNSEEDYVSMDPEAQQALFRVSVHADMGNVFCIIPDGDYCLPSSPGTYKLQETEVGLKNPIFSFVAFDGVNPDYYFAFDDDNDLTYGNYTNGLENFEKLWIRKRRRNDKQVKFAGYTNDQSGGITKKLETIGYSYDGPENCYGAGGASSTAYFFASNCNRGTSTDYNIIGLYDAGTSHPYRYNYNSPIDSIDLIDGYSSNTAQTLQLVDDDAPTGYEWASTFDYCLDYQNANSGWTESNNGYLNWFGFDTYDDGFTIDGKVITVSFNFKFNGVVPPTQNAQGHGMGLKIAGVDYSDWFGADDECVGNWCRFSETLTLTSTVDEQKILFFWNQVSNGEGEGEGGWGCFFRFNDFKVEW